MRRVVSLLPAATEMLYLLGVSPVAVSHECDFPSAAQALPRATTSRVDSAKSSGDIDADVKALLDKGEPLYLLNRELIERLAPEVIVTQAQCDVCAVRHADVVDLVASSPHLLRQTQVIALNPSSLGDCLADLLCLGQSVDRQARAEMVVAGLQSRIAAVVDKTRSLALIDKPRTVVIEWIDPLMTAGNWTPELIELAGGMVCLATPQAHSAYVAWQDIVAAQPQVLLIAPCGFDLERSLREAKLLRRLPGWDQLPAVANGRAWVIDGNQYLNRPGPRLVETLEIAAHLVQPQHFPPPDLKQAFKRVL